MRKILVPFDGSESAQRAIQHAASVVRDSPSIQLDLLFVVDPMVERAQATMSEEENQNQIHREAEQVLQPAMQVLDQAGVKYEYHSRVGSPANEIAEHSREAGCEAIIMGTRGLGPVASVVVGSTATRVVHLADVPVTLIK